METKTKERQKPLEEVIVVEHYYVPYKGLLIPREWVERLKANDQQEE